jgi:hypothetical protein
MSDEVRDFATGVVCGAAFVVFVWATRRRRW